MHNVMFRGSGVNESTLTKIVKNMYPSNKQRVLDNYWYLLDDSKSADDNIKMLVCLMPARGLPIPRELYEMQLLQGPSYVIPKDYKHTLKAYASYILENYDEERVSKLCKAMDVHKHCPDKYKTKHMLLICIMQETIDDFRLNVDDVEFDQMLEYMEKYMYEHPLVI